MSEDHEERMRYFTSPTDDDRRIRHFTDSADTNGTQDGVWHLVPDPTEDRLATATVLRWVGAGLLAMVFVVATCSGALLTSKSCARTGENGLDPLTECWK